MPSPHKYRILTCSGSVWRLTEASFQKYMERVASDQDAPDLDDWPGATIIPTKGQIYNITDITPEMARGWLEDT